MVEFPAIGESYKNVNSNFERCTFKQDEATSKDTPRAGPETACHSSSDCGPCHAHGCKVSCHFPHFISFDAQHIQLLVAKPSSTLLNPTWARRTQMCEAKTLALLQRETMSVRENYTAIWKHRRTEIWKKYTK